MPALLKTNPITRPCYVTSWDEEARIIFLECNNDAADADPYPGQPTPFTDDGEVDCTQLRDNLLSLSPEHREAYLEWLGLTDSPEDYL